MLLTKETSRILCQLNLEEQMKSAQHHQLLLVPAFYASRSGNKNIFKYLMLHIFI